MEAKKVWFVTGASNGLGLALVRKLLADGNQVAATSRNLQSLVEKVGTPSGTFLPLAVDLTDNGNVRDAIAACVNHFGRIDVVVNNAGFGLIGTVEELTDREVKDNFNVNVFGALNVIRNAAPHLRQQRSGHILNIASIGGYAGGFPGFGIYCATKFAMAGFTEGLAEEMSDFGVYATVVYPGYFRTNFLSKDAIKTAAAPIAAYTRARASEQAHLEQIAGNQPNDPEKAAEVLIEVSKLETPPVHLFLGEDAYALANQKISLIQQTMAEHEKLGTSTKYQ